MELKSSKTTDISVLVQRKNESMQTKPSAILVGNLFERWKSNNLSVVHRRLGYESMHGSWKSYTTHVFGLFMKFHLEYMPHLLLHSMHSTISTFFFFQLMPETCHLLI